MGDIRIDAAFEQRLLRVLGLLTKPSDEELFELASKLLAGKLEGTDAWAAQALVALYPADGDCG